MVTAINMPQIGQDIDKGVILEWYVNEGDRVEKGDIIATVESEKAAFEVEAFESGILIKIIRKAGDEAEVLKPIAYIGESGEITGNIQPELQKIRLDNAEPPVNEINEDKVQVRHNRIFASPTARRMAREHNLVLDKISGSGPNGRIIKRDIILIIGNDTPEHKKVSVSDRVIHLSRRQNIIATRLSHSKQNIPHFYLFREVNVSNALTSRNKYNEHNQVHLSINDLIIYTVSRILKEFPRLNAHMEEGKLILKGNVNIGLAVGVEEGLLVPVIQDADRKTVAELSTLSKDIISKAQHGKITSGMPGTFTVSNLGMYGISYFQAIINPPEVAVLSVGGIEKRAIPTHDGFGFADFITLGLACDHRVIDGVYGAKFLKALSHELENIKI